MRLEIEGLTAGYGGIAALRGIDLVVPSGRAVALLGPNGAGKTTLLSTISGLVAARSGHIRADGTDITSSAMSRRAEMGICHVTEGRAVFPSLTVADNLRLFAPPGDEDPALERAIDAFPKLGQRLSQIAGTMSGGEQQMLALARAYTRRSPLVLLDEVSMGLAPIIVDGIFEFLRRLADEGTTLLVVEQYITRALELADFFYIVNRGRVALAGEPTEVVADEIAEHYLGA